MRRPREPPGTLRPRGAEGPAEVVSHVLLMAYSGHTSVASLARYTRVSPEALQAWQQERDPARRR
ncbi:MAG TPA: hypothetical protein VNW94_12055 [Streptosporangiaceae bacterium]|nr:hypothetical protein [Streptosporangiaceae bacterium]